MLALGTVPLANDAAAGELPFVHPLFSDHVVLQRGVPVPIWGWAEPGTKSKWSLRAKLGLRWRVRTGNGWRS